MKINWSKKWMAIALSAVVLVGVVFALRSKPNAPVTNFEPEFENEQTQETTPSSEGRGIRIPGYSVIPVAANSQEVSVDLHNPEENNVYFQIAFYLKDTDEKIFESKLIKPGQHLYTITLNRELEPGEYLISMQYSTFSTDGTYEPRNGATLDCTLRAE